MRAVQPQLREQDSNVRESTTYLIGALFALHDAPNGKGNMGGHFRAMCSEGGDPPPNVERRFMSLLACDADDFDVALRQAVMLLKSKNVPIDWHQLIRDAMRWKGSDAARRDQVRKWWARSFWRRRDGGDGATLDQAEDRE